jgi:hypothetical protein
MGSEETKLLISIVGRLWHPFQEAYLTAEPTPLQLDDWLKSQIAAGLVKVVSDAVGDALSQEDTASPEKPAPRTRKSVRESDR